MEKESLEVLYSVNDNPKALGYTSDINRNQYNTLIKLKEKLIRESILQDFSEFNDVTLLKFLRSKNFNLDQTFKMLEECVKWRISAEIDQIENMKFEDLKDLRKFYPHIYHKTDRQGRPVYFENMSQIKIDGVLKFGEDRLIKYYTRDYEVIKYRFMACSKAFGHLVEEYVTVVNLQGVGFGLYSGKVKNLMSQAAKIGENYYPESLHKSIIINAPAIFNILWSLVKNFLNKNTRRKSLVLSTNYKDKLFELIDPANIPTIFGGTCTCSHIQGGCMLSDIGPWNPEGGMPEE